MGNCPTCGLERAPGMAFCGRCGYRFGTACPSCGHPADGAAVFCGNCGTNLGQGEPSSVPPPAPIAAEVPAAQFAAEVPAAQFAAEPAAVTPQTFVVVPRSRGGAVIAGVLLLVVGLLLAAVFGYNAYLGFNSPQSQFLSMFGEAGADRALQQQMPNIIAAGVGLVMALFGIGILIGRAARGARDSVVCSGCRRLAQIARSKLRSGMWTCPMCATVNRST